MPKTSFVGLNPRKSPVQKRSIATVDSIQKATIQVLIRKGPERLTTVLVARLAGVSVGTLYQYFPNKNALLFAVLEGHLKHVANSLEQACVANHEQPLESMMTEIVKHFLEAKLADREVSVALYRIAGGLGGDLIVDRFRNRCEQAIADMLRSEPIKRHRDMRFAAQMIFLTMAGVLRGYLENSAPSRNDTRLREQLTQLVCAYTKSI